MKNGKRGRYINSDKSVVRGPNNFTLVARTSSINQSTAVLMLIRWFWIII